MLRLLVVDDHPIFRKGLVGLIQDACPDCRIQEANDGTGAIDLIISQSFDIIILDIDMPQKSGIDVLRYARDKELKNRIVILTMHNDELFFNEAFDLGAKGFVLKEDSSMEIIDCIESVKMDIPFVSKKLKPYLVNRSNFSKQMKSIKEGLDSLTKAELNTLRLVSLDKTSKEIAEMLFVTEKSVENYRSRICKKLDIKGGSNSLYKWCVTHKEYIP